MSELYRYTFELEDLAKRYPPRFAHPNKQAFYNKVSSGSSHGPIEVTRWAGADVPARRSSHRPGLIARPGFFTYDSPDTATTMHWHLNFAHHDLFAFWDGPLLAQDQMQYLNTPTWRASGSPSSTLELLPEYPIETVPPQS